MDVKHPTMRIFRDVSLAPCAAPTWFCHKVKEEGGGGGVHTCPPLAKSCFHTCPPLANSCFHTCPAKRTINTCLAMACHPPNPQHV